MIGQEQASKYLVHIQPDLENEITFGNQGKKHTHDVAHSHLKESSPIAERRFGATRAMSVLTGSDDGF